MLPRPNILAATKLRPAAVDMKTTQPHRAPLIDHHYTRLKRFVQVTVRDAWVAEEIVQETFLRAHRKRHTLRDEGRIAAWLYQIAYRLCVDHFRARARQPEDKSADPAASKPPPAPSLEHMLEQHQMSVCVQRQILKLAAPYRSVIWLFHVLDFSLQETATILAISEANVKTRLHRARRKLKAVLETHCAFERDTRNVFICEPKMDGDESDWNLPGG